jgi:hypothetical protein
LIFFIWHKYFIKEFIMNIPDTIENVAAIKASPTATTISATWKGNAGSLEIGGEFFPLHFRDVKTSVPFHTTLGAPYFWEANKKPPGTIHEFTWTFATVAEANAALPKFDDIIASNSVTDVAGFTAYIAAHNITRTVKIL